MKFALGADHAGVGFRERLLRYLREEGHEVEDFGTCDDESCDYPEYAHRVAQTVASDPEVRGLLVCGSGQGMVMTANRYPGVRAALCLSGEMAAKTRGHNDANCLVLAERSMDYEQAVAAVDAFVETPFDGGRHARRIGKIDNPSLQVVTHPLVRTKLSGLRDEGTPVHEFQELVHEVSTLLFVESSRTYSINPRDVRTPIQSTVGHELNEEYLLVPILRAGLGMVHPIREILPDARVGHLGFSRNEQSLEAEEYYRNLPRDLKDPQVTVLDPMLATGGTASAALSALKDEGVDGTLRMLCIVAAPEGVDRVHEEHPDVSIYTASLDEGLNDQGFIVPGLGDAGDRLYGTF